MALAIPTSVEECTPEWLTAALQSREVIDEGTLITACDVELLSTGQGFMCDTARLTLHYDRGTGPASIIAKIPTVVPDNRKGGEIAE